MKQIYFIPTISWFVETTKAERSIKSKGLCFSWGLGLENGLGGVLITYNGYGYTHIILKT